MKLWIKRLLGLGVCVGMLAAAASSMAAVEDCPDPEAEQAEGVPGMVSGLPGQTSKCKPVNFAESLEPVNPGAVAPLAPLETAQPLPQVESVTDRGAADLAGAKESATDYTNREMLRVGEFDARQGKPVNVRYAETLAYMQGYMKGQEMRMRGAGAAGGGVGGVRGIGR